DPDPHVLLDLHLAGAAPVFLGLAAGEVGQFGRQDVAAALEDLTLARRAGAAPTAPPRQEAAVAREAAQQRSTAVDLGRLLRVVVDQDLDLALVDELRLREHQDEDQEDDDERQARDADQDALEHFLPQSWMPLNVMNAMAISPVVMNAMPRPRSEAGMCAVRSRCRMAASDTIASIQPNPAPKPKTTDWVNV